MEKLNTPISIALAITLFQFQISEMKPVSARTTLMAHSLATVQVESSQEPMLINQALLADVFLTKMLLPSKQASTVLAHLINAHLLQLLLKIATKPTALA